MKKLDRIIKNKINRYLFIVELEKGVWIAPWDGDPGRTIVKKNAKIFSNKIEADYALICARVYRPFINARILKYEA